MYDQFFRYAFPIIISLIIRRVFYSKVNRQWYDYTGTAIITAVIVFLLSLKP